jgi:FkbM family methyltransferase
MEVETDLGPLWAERGGHVVTAALLSNAAWDTTISGLIRTALTAGDTFVDAGANIGYFTVLASRQVGPGGRVFAIEPDSLNLAILRANLERHGCSNTTVLPVAAWHEPAKLNIMRPAAEGAIARVGGPGVGGDQITAAPLDDLIEGQVDYVKIDTELTDHLVVKGARRILAENPSMLVTVEFHPWETTHTGDKPAEVLRVYRELGLTPYAITPPGDGVMQTTFDRIADPDLEEGHNCFDFAMSRRMPEGLLYRPPLLERVGTRLLGPRGLERAGDLLGHIPERIRPKFRHRDRTPG